MTRLLPPKAFADPDGRIDRAALRQAQDAMTANQPWTSRVAKALLSNPDGVGIDTVDDAWLERYFYDDTEAPTSF